MQKSKQIFSALHTLYRLVTSSRNIQSFAVGIARLYKRFLNAERTVIVCSTFTNKTFIRCSISDKAQIIKKGKFSKILTKKEKEVIKKGIGVTSKRFMAQPFIFSNTLGAIHISRKSDKPPFTDFEKRYFSNFSEQVGIYLKILELYQGQQKIILSYIESLNSLFNAHSLPSNHVHSRGITTLVHELGKKMKLTDTEIKALEYASMLHDTGKINIPSRLLKKQHPLTKKEYRIIKEHPKNGVKLIKKVDALKPVIPIILYHHERYDGTGYPAQLEKNQIPLSSRILAVIDAFDAMYFGRPYKKRMKLEAVESELKRQKGKQFDPKVIKSFLDILKRKKIRKYLKSSR
jgi:HD-GYP domain-containing protein (c-di-GMP phosphodiesterase class II)